MFIIKFVKRFIPFVVIAVLLFNVSQVRTVALFSAKFEYEGFVHIIPNQPKLYAIRVSNLILDSSQLFRYKAKLWKNGVEFSGLEIFYPELPESKLDDTNTWKKLTSNADGVVYFGPSTGMLTSMLPGIETDAGIQTPFYTTLPVGEYELQISLVDLDGKVLIEDIIYKFAVVLDNTPPELSILGFTADEKDMQGDVSRGYILFINGDSSVDHALQFKAGSLASEDLKEDKFELFLKPENGQSDKLFEYYKNKNESFKAYLNDAAIGKKPFALIKGSGDRSLKLLDAAMYQILNRESDMVVPDDFPTGTYHVEGIVKDFAENETKVSLKLIVTDDKNPPLLNVNGFMDLNKELISLGNNYYELKTTNKTDIFHSIDFKAGSSSTEPLKNDLIGVFLVPTSSQIDILQEYYLKKSPGYKDYLDSAASGTKAFAFIKVANETELSLIDAAQYEVESRLIPMVVPDDFPLGEYSVKGEISDLYNNTSTINFVLVVSGDRVAPEIKLNSENKIFIKMGSVFENHATCSDDVDETCNVTTTTNLDVNIEGEYVVTYNAEDISGNKAKEELRVFVVSHEELKLKIIEAKDLLAKYSPGQYPAVAKKLLEEAILKAEHIAPTSSKETVNLETKELITAIENYNNSKLPPVVMVGGGGGGGGAIVPPPFAPAYGFRAKYENLRSQGDLKMVTLILEGGNAVRMAISNSVDFQGISQEPYKPTKNWIIADGDGPKYIFIKFYDQYGNSSSVISLLVNEPKVKPAVLGEKISRLDGLVSKYKLGDFGAEVKELQIELQKIGYFPKNIKTTNYFGNTTNKAVKDYIKTKNLPVVENASDVEILEQIKSIKFGQRNQKVKQLQDELKKLGFFPLKQISTGYYGIVTKNSVEKYLKSLQ